MSSKTILEEVTLEQLYRHILALEGIKHHEEDPKKLNDAAEYIKKEMDSYGLEVKEQLFSLEGIDQKFRNIEAVLGEGVKPEILITSHYDTVENSPGANDNASAIAAMLEVARVLAKEKMDAFNIRFVSFTLEELHPARYTNLFNKRFELGLLDEKNRYKSYHTQQMVREFQKTFTRLIIKRKSFGEACKIAYDNIRTNLNEKERLYVEYLIESLQDIQTPTDWIGKTALVGSTKWVERAVEEGREVKGVINLETIGYTSKQTHSQKLPSKLFKLLPKYKVNMRKEVGDFIAIIGEKNSKKLAYRFFQQCKEIDLPAVNICLPMSFETIARRARDLLRSDHSPFWQRGIPALMITDTANFRYPYYHTEADTIDKLNFDFIRKVCQATLACVLELDGRKEKH
ncbi:MAG: M28 family peptidase [Candidatus Heimdallarchaeota archaeon]|nr:M28 family peptidase [Candidatus Heimdallarchaeota archaeon]